jgi:hypothetical protein
MLIMGLLVGTTGCIVDPMISTIPTMMTTMTAVSKTTITVSGSAAWRWNGALTKGNANT